jgi:hypothetical protein
VCIKAQALHDAKEEVVNEGGARPQLIFLRTPQSRKFVEETVPPPAEWRSFSGIAHEV